MKYEYTYNHILLLAKVCGIVENEDSLTASWVQITEEHNHLTFPFTLWPLTYRTCEVTTSPAMCTPVYLPSTNPELNFNVKLIKCNEVVIICIQDGSPDDETCVHPCLADFVEAGTGGESDDASSENEGAGTTSSSLPNHTDHHSLLSSSKNLLPCYASHCYREIQADLKNAFYDIQENVECVICTGHGAAANIASCLACDMSLAYEAEREFLGLSRRRVVVDFVGFSDNVVASPAYWGQCSASIDKYICVVFKEASKETSVRTTPAFRSNNQRTKIMVPNPRCIHVAVDSARPTSSEHVPPSRSVSVLQQFANKQRQKKKDRGKKHGLVDKSISAYISAVRNKIKLQGI